MTCAETPKKCARFCNRPGVVDEPHVHLMNRPRLQGVVGPFVPKLARGNAAELCIGRVAAIGSRAVRSPRLQSPSSAVTSRGDTIDAIN